MAQRLGIPLLDPDGDAFMADDQADDTRFHPEVPPRNYYTNLQNYGLRWHPFPPSIPRFSPAASEDRLALPLEQSQPAMRNPMNYPNSFEPYYPTSFGNLRYLPPPFPRPTAQPQLFRPSGEIGSNSTANLPTRPAFREQPSSVEPRESLTSELEAPTSLPRLSTVLPNHMYIDRDRQQQTRTREPPSQRPRESNRTSQQPARPPPFRLRTHDSPELIEASLRQSLGGSPEKLKQSNPEPTSVRTGSSNDMANSRPRQHEIRASPPLHVDMRRPIQQNPALLESIATSTIPVDRAPQPPTPRPRHRRRMSRPPIPRVACTACMEDFKLDDLLNLACACRYCIPCLNAAFRAGCTSKAAFPPKCCGRPLRISVWGSMLESEILERYKLIEAEFSASRPLYCATKTCSTFIPEHQQNPSDDVGFCPTCQAVTCSRCKKIMEMHPQWEHDKRICPADDAEVTALYALGSVKKWRQCPTCLNMVERTEGCNHMDCVCGVEFCYRCGNLFDEDDNCGCDPNSWDDDDEDDDDDEGDDGDDDDDGGENGIDRRDENEESEDSEAEEWPNFRAAVDASGRPMCLHLHTETLGDDVLACHGCLRMRPLRGCNDCGVELCQSCVERVRNGARGRDVEPSDDD